MIKKQRSKATDQTKVTFILPAGHSYGDISLVGDFNDWDASKNRFIKRSNQTYSTSVTLASESKFFFRYLTDDGIWVNEAEADGYEESGFGSDNCVLLT
jgi:hypothetical protein